MPKDVYFSVIKSANWFEHLQAILLIRKNQLDYMGEMLGIYRHRFETDSKFRERQMLHLERYKFKPERSVENLLARDMELYIAGEKITGCADANIEIDFPEENIDFNITFTVKRGSQAYYTLLRLAE